MTTKKKRPRDANQLGKSIVDIATGEIQKTQLAPSAPAPAKATTKEPAR